MNRQKLVQEFRESAGGSTASSLNKLLECLIEECHKANETNRGDEFLATQGEIMGYRKLQNHLIREKKKNKNA